jgi:hypothetical protein
VITVWLNDNTGRALQERTTKRQLLNFAASLQISRWQVGAPLRAAKATDVLTNALALPDPSLPKLHR